MHPALLFLSSFSVVFLLVFQQMNVQMRSHKLASITSVFITLSQVVVFKGLAFGGVPEVAAMAAIGDDSSDAQADLAAAQAELAAAQEAVTEALEAVTGRDRLVIDSADGDCKIANIHVGRSSHALKKSCVESSCVCVGSKKLFSHDDDLQEVRRLDDAALGETVCQGAGHRPEEHEGQSEQEGRDGLS